MKYLYSTLLVSAWSASHLVAAPLVLLDDRFSDGDRTTQNPPTSSAWFYRGGSGAMSVSDNELHWNIGTGNAIALTYFSATPVTLAVGEALTASFTLRVDGVGSSLFEDAFRLGVFNSKGVRVTEDYGPSRFSSVFDNYEGYHGSLDPLTTANNVFRGFRRGTQVVNDLLTTSSKFLGPSTAGPAWEDDDVFDVVMTAERLANGMQWTVSFGDVTLDVFDEGSTYFSFDTLGIHVAGPANTAQHLYLSDVYVAVVPEAHSILLGLGGAAMVLWISRRRREACTQ